MQIDNSVLTGCDESAVFLLDWIRTLNMLKNDELPSGQGNCPLGSKVFCAALFFSGKVINGDLSSMLHTAFFENIADIVFNRTFA